MVKKKNLIITAITLFLIDQIIKQIATTGASYSSKIISFTLVKNQGITWGLFQEANTLMIWVSLIVIGTIIYNYYEFTEKSQKTIFFLISGITSNLIDRIIRGHVIDYINLGWWPVFNLADAMIIISIIILITEQIKELKLIKIR